VKVYDRDIVGSDFCGSCVVPLDKLMGAPGDELEGWYFLEDEPSKTYNVGTKNPGQVRVKLHYPKGISLRGVIKSEDPKKSYRFESVLGSGAFATVKKATQKSTGKLCAVKCIRKKKLTEANKTLLEREISIMAKLHHPYIVEMFEAFDTPKYTYLVLELVTGGELLEELINRDKPYTEKEAMHYIRQILKAVEYMHSMGVAHRDLKPENLLLDASKQNVKISDFGLSKDFEKAGGEMMTSCGTATYVAPEVLMATGYDPICDVWSVGVITYVLLSAHIPFDGQTENQVFQKILRAQFRFPSPMWDDITEDAKDFIRKIFVVDPKKRMTVSECLDHNWLNGENEEKLDRVLPSNLRDNLRQMHASEKALRAQMAPSKADDDDSDLEGGDD
jgi:calcium/calmodulin-dependent protein kinase I